MKPFRLILLLSLFALGFSEAFASVAPAITFFSEAVHPPTLSDLLEHSPMFLAGAMLWLIFSLAALLTFLDLRLSRVAPLARADQCKFAAGVTLSLLAISGIWAFSSQLRLSDLREQAARKDSAISTILSSDNFLISAERNALDNSIYVRLSNEAPRERTITFAGKTTTVTDPADGNHLVIPLAELDRLQAWLDRRGLSRLAESISANQALASL